MQARAIAALVLTEILTRRQSLSTILPDYLERMSVHRDQSFVQELCYGVLRWYYRLNFIAQNLLEKDLKAKDTDVKALILLGLYQLGYLRTPPHAAVSATVEACVDINKPWAKKLVNAILRRAQKESDYLQTLVKDDLEAEYAHPSWLLQSLQQDYPEHWQGIAQANNIHPPMYLRVNNKQSTRSDYLAELQKNNIDATETLFSPCAIRLNKAVDVEYLPLFTEGAVSVQDLAAQLTIPLLDIQTSQRVLDACAAPGGKLAHILEQPTHFKEVIAIESDTKRFDRLQETLDRTKLKATLINTDARNTEDWWDGTPFDRILLDLPCSATGVIRRHPDIKVLRRADDISAITQTQVELLSALWPLLAQGGKLLYVTCSVLNIENDQQIQAFIQDHPDAQVIMNQPEWGRATIHGRQILPGDNDMDGFYYACLEKS